MVCGAGQDAGTRRQVQLTDIYDTWRMPPYGMKNGVMPMLVLLIMLVKRDRVAVYEHGSYVPRISPGTAERMVKNPQQFLAQVPPRGQVPRRPH